MALSKDTMRPLWPKDFSTIIRDGVSASGANFSPGTLVVRVDGLFVACDAAVALHKTLPVEMVWTDGQTRLDLERYELDGTKLQGHTTACGKFIAEIASTVFTSTPNPGDILTKSATAGKIDPIDAATFNSLESGDALAQLLVVGRCVGNAELSGSGFHLCHFDLS